MRRDEVTPVKGKVVYYKQDGTGRDQYIKHDNGGLLSEDAVHRLKPKPEPIKSRMVFGKTYQTPLPPKLENKFPHYISDGSGRDYYVTNDEGGNSNVHRWRNQVDHRFKSTLRNYNKIRLIDPENEDVFTMSQSRMTWAESMRSRSISHGQFGQTMKLSQPKIIRQPPPIHTYFPSFYDTTRRARMCENSPLYNS